MTQSNGYTEEVILNAYDFSNPNTISAYVVITS